MRKSGLRVAAGRKVLGLGIRGHSRSENAVWGIGAPV